MPGHVFLGVSEHYISDAEISGTHSVEFTKKVDISIYFPDRGIELLSESFSVEDDVPLNSLNANLKAVFARIDPTEVFFSAKCAFPEKDTGESVIQSFSSVSNLSIPLSNILTT